MKLYLKRFTALPLFLCLLFSGDEPMPSKAESLDVLSFR